MPRLTKEHYTRTDLAPTGRCEEASPLSGNSYIPCGQPAVSLIRHDKDNRTYRMCAACAHHNVDNRGGKLVKAYDGPPAEDTPVTTSSVAPVLNPSADDLIAEYLSNSDWLSAESKRFGEHCKPIHDRQATIENQLLEKLNSEGGKNIKTDHGTAYKSSILQTKIDADGEAYKAENGEVRGREAVLDSCLDHWEEYGNEMLMINVQKDAVKAYIEKNGKPPPGVTISYFTRVNIRRS